MAVHLVTSYQSKNGSRYHRSALPAAKLRRAVDRIRGSLDRGIRLSELANAAGMSEAYFSKMFKNATGLSPSDYTIRLKMEQARRLLRETDMPILQVALEVGYNSRSHFSQIFRRKLGVAPSAYRGK